MLQVLVPLVIVAAFVMSAAPVNAETAAPTVAAPVPPGILNPLSIPKYVNQLTGAPPV